MHTPVRVVGPLVLALGALELVGAFVSWALAAIIVANSAKSV